MQLIANLHVHLGYGGLIHQFKNYILRGEKKYIDVFHQRYQKASLLLIEYKKLPSISLSELKNIEILENTFDTYKRHLTRAVNLKSEQKTIKEIDAVIKIDDNPAFNALNDLENRGHLDIEPTDWWRVATRKINLLKTIEDHISSDLRASAMALKKEAQSLFIFYLLMASGMILFTFMLSYYLARGITNPLKSLVNVANQISSGNREIKIRVKSKDEIEDLSSAMVKMLDSVNHSEQQLKKSSQAYARFVPDEFLQWLSKDNILDIQLGNHAEMNLTILFSDIRSFTTLSEKMSPQSNFNLINDYLKTMGPIIRQHRGFIDKYIGDAIMALFLIADDALNAGIAMLQQLEMFNKNHNAVSSPLQIGIGINTGKLMLGIIGEENRLQCTVISDAVNIASRLENLTKTYKNSLIISQNTFDQITNPSQYAIRFLDNIKVKGRSERINIFEVLDGEPTEMRELKLATLKTFERAVSLYQKHQFNKVKELMKTCLHKNPQDIVAEMYIQRCQNFLIIDENDNWEKLAQKIEWAPDLLIGNQLIDEQHKAIFAKTKNLVMSIGSGETEEESDEMISFLESYIATHFEIEEMYMQLYHYPDDAFHKEQHTQFIDTFNKIKINKNRWGHLYLALHIQYEIADWLVHHIGGADKELGLFLKGKM